MSLLDDAHRTELLEAGWHTRGYLPHFDGTAVSQFITLHLADSIPQKIIRRWEEELQYMKERPRRAWLEKRIHKYLDQGYGNCLLGDPRIANIVQDSLLFLGKTKCKIFSWVIMPNHVHTLLKRSDDVELEQILQSFKSYTAHEANKLLSRKGQFWFPEYFDRRIRNEKHFCNTLKYIENNPVKAGLCRKPSDWPFSSAWFRKNQL